jgi:hypothetical protein
MRSNPLTRIMSLGLLVLYPSEPTVCAKDTELSAIVSSLAFKNRQNPQLAFAPDAEFFLHIAVRTARGAEENFYAGQWRPDGATKPVNAAVFQTWIFSPDRKRFEVSWRQLEPNTPWSEFFDSLNRPELYAKLSKLRPDDNISILDGVRIEVEIQYKRTHIRTIIRNPRESEQEVQEYLSLLERLFGFKFRL